MKVVFKKTNTIEEVNDSYALNYLIPKGIAVKATDEILRQRAEESEEAKERSKEKQERQAETAKQLEGKTVTIKTKANEKGELYGSVGVQQIKKSLKIKDKVAVKLKEPIKHTGTYPITLKIGSSRVTITLTVASS